MFPWAKFRRAKRGVKAHVLSDHDDCLPSYVPVTEARTSDVRVAVWDPANQREVVLLTDLLHFGATTIAAIYKDRWEIELFFNALKQNLKVKSLVGTSRNAPLIRIWTALIALLLLKWLDHLPKAKWSLCNPASMLRLRLFTYRDLRQRLGNRFGTPPLGAAGSSSENLPGAVVQRADRRAPAS